jgi:hypothetical protein
MPEIKNNINMLIPYNFILNGVICIDYTYFFNKSDQYLDECLKYIKHEYNLFVLFFPEEFIYNAQTIKIIDKCLKIQLKLLIYSLNPVLDKFIKLQYTSENIFTNNSNSLFNNTSLVSELKNINQFDIENKSIKLLFLNYNRKANRDYIILKLKEVNELYDKSNYISFHNKYKFEDIPYESFYMDYINENYIDIDFLNNFELIPDKINVNNQLETQLESYKLYSKSKFNIICEPFFGYYKDINSYDYYNHIITKKTILPLLYKNVFFIYEYNDLLSTSLTKLGFELFFNSLDDFLTNMNDDYLLLDSTIEKLNHNQKLVIKLLEVGKLEFYNKLKTLSNEI